MGVSGEAAIATFYAFGTCTPGYCLHYVWSAYKANGATTSCGCPTALDGWNASGGKHNGDLNAPRGVPMWLGAKSSSAAGDVVISLGGGQVAATDWPYNGVIGTCSIQQRLSQTGRPYLGWTETILDYPIDFGPVHLEPYQRQVISSAAANGRSDPSTQNPATQQLAPYTVADMQGWINGENVSGNQVWFKGLYSGDFFWSGGFTSGPDGTGLTDLNTAKPTQPNQRQVGSGMGANGRPSPKTSDPAQNILAPNTVATMDGWITGESVEGNSVWFRTGGLYYWSGGFTSQSTDSLPDLNNPKPPDPDPTADRTVGPNTGANGRKTPFTSDPAAKVLPANTTVTMDGWAAGEVVEGNGTWFRTDGLFYWSGGFTSTSTDGLQEVDGGDPPDPADKDNPRGLPEYAPVYTRAVKGLEAPLGFTDCHNPVTPTPRNKAGSDQHPVDPIIDRFIIHWTGVTPDQLDYFSYCNDRSSCPSYYLNGQARTFEMIRPLAKPASTGPDWNWRSIAVETQMLSDTSKPISDDQLEELAQMIAWLSTFDGKHLDSIPVSFTIDREHVIGHREALPGSTDCPGDYLMSKMDSIIARAQVIAGEEPNPPDPNPGYLDPDEFPTLYALKGELDRAFDPTRTAPEEEPTWWERFLGWLLGR